MRRHDRYLKMKRSIIALVYILVIVLMILVYMITKRAEQKRQTPAAPEKAVQTVHCAPPSRTGVATIK
jgi:hypothetical protein